jgi:hypothetical protein
MESLNESDDAFDLLMGVRPSAGTGTRERTDTMY